MSEYHEPSHAVSPEWTVDAVMALTDPMWSTT